jgi:hypothetical protein
MRKLLTVKSATLFALAFLVGLLAVLPFIKAMVPEIFPTMEGFGTVDCANLTCQEGEFCQNNRCISRSGRYGNVPEGNQ